MALHPQAGQPADPKQLINVAKLVSDYYAITPNVDVPEQRVAFGTSGHRGSAQLASFNDMHIAAIAQALADYRFEDNSQDYIVDTWEFIDVSATSLNAADTIAFVLSSSDVGVRYGHSGCSRSYEVLCRLYPRGKCKFVCSYMCCSHRLH